ncbi:MAG: TIGR02444 family protein [Kiloniellales bacterium]
MATESKDRASANPFWDYSLALYAKPDVAEACLGLQDRHGLDVNLLLFCCWAGSRGHRLTPGELERLIAAVTDWHRQVVVPLRGLRRWLKGRAATAQGAAGALRARIKAQELEAERIEQELLHAALPLAGGEPCAEAAAANLLALCRASDVRLDRADRAVQATLLAQAFPGDAEL